MKDIKIQKRPFEANRRNFIQTGLKLAAGSALLTFPPITIFAAGKEYTVEEVINIILKDIPGAPFEDTVDTLKSGSADQKVSGIVTTMFATVEVIKKAAELDANFIIAHEPTFYNHTDDVSWTGQNSVVQQKQALLKKLGITVWRFHDHWHAHKPDGIMYGVLKKTNWLSYNRQAGQVFTIPSSSLKQIAEHLKASLNIERVRVIGNLSQLCQKIVLLPGAWGGQNQVTTIEREKPDLVIIGEANEWETAEYIRDGSLLGSKVSLIVLGHSVSEEPGMEWLVEWLQPKLDSVRITHIASNNPFMFV